jgi:hypothetical protein
VSINQYFAEKYQILQVQLVSSTKAQLEEDSCFEILRRQVAPLWDTASGCERLDPI